MSDLDQYADVLPVDTISTWLHLARAVPDDGVLMGGTALTIHLRHRQSRDLDIFTEGDFDPEQVAARLRAEGRFATTGIDDGTLNGVFGSTKVQVLWAKDQVVLEPPHVLAGLGVGSISDIFATKLKVIGDRGELRDYYDILRIEQDTGRTVEEGLQLVRARYGDDRSTTTIEAIVKGLGYFDDVIDDPYLVERYGPVVRDDVVRYWTARQPEVLASLDPRASP